MMLDNFGWVRAAMDTPAGDSTLFADTYESHLANIKVACQNGVLTGEAC